MSLMIVIGRFRFGVLGWALMLMVGVVMLHPSVGWAAAPSACAAADAISQLEPDERARLRKMCEGDATLTGRDRTTVLAGLRLEGWQSAFVARALATVSPPAGEAVERQREHERWISSVLARTTTKGTGRSKTEVPACTSFTDAVTGTVEDLQQERAPIPASLRDLGADSACILDDEQAQFEELSQGWRLLTIPGRARDVIEAWAIDLRTLEARYIQPIAYLDGADQVFVLLLPRDHLVTVSVQQPDLDVPWVETRRLVDIDFALPRRTAECVIIEAGTDVGSDWSVVVDGSVIPLEVVSEHEKSLHTERAILALPRERGAFAGSRRPPRELVFISARPGAAPWVSSLAESLADHGRCRSVAYDLTGLFSSQEHVGVAQVVVDQQCRDRGIVPSRVRSYVESYAEWADKTLIPLDAWAEVMEVFRDLESRLGSKAEAERGASRGDLDDSEQMVVLASELRRKGIDSLLYFDVRCPQSSSGVTVIGTRVGLDNFVGRARSKVTGVDTDELLAVRSHDSHSRALRESMEVVLSELLGQSHIRFIEPPRVVERGQHRKLRAVGLTPGLDLQVWALPVTNAAVCSEVEAFNELSSFGGFAQIQQLAARNGRSVLQRHSEKTQIEVELGGLREGTYLAVATEAPHDGSSPDEQPIGYALCFAVEERRLDVFADIGGFGQLSQPRNSPIPTRLSFLRVGAGVRYRAWEYFEFGGRVGYELVEYRSRVVPSWDDLALIDLPDNAETTLSWQRNGVLVGPFMGLRVPFGRMPWPLCKKGSDKKGSDKQASDCEDVKQRRRANPRIAAFFLTAQAMVNVGLTRTNDLPAEIIEGESRAGLGADIDLGVTSGIRLSPNGVTNLGVFAGVLLTDLANARNINAVENSFWTNDWGVRGIVGFEVGMAWARR